MSESLPLAPGLYLVATPIGNLQDMTLRALDVLQRCDRVACEDTRQTIKLLNHFQISKPMVSYHLHNEHARTEELIAAMQSGTRIALVSDAGMPGIADPGIEMVRAAIAAGISVFPVPGANAALSGLIASGLNTERFVFQGFLPSKSGERRSALEAVRASFSALPATQIFYETPHRIVETLADVEAVFGSTHEVALARELTKLHEEFLRGPVQQVRALLAQRENVRGEMVLMLSGVLEVQDDAAQGSVADAVRALLQEGLEEKEALKRVARDRNIGKSDVYREWQREKKR